MNARVFLLFLVTGSFMAVWNSDHEAMQTALAKRQKIKQAEIANIADMDLLKTSGELFSHDEAEWQAWVEATETVEVTVQDLVHAEGSENIELQHPAVTPLTPVLASIEDPMQIDDPQTVATPAEDQQTDNEPIKEFTPTEPGLVADPQNDGPSSAELAPPVVPSEEDLSKVIELSSEDQSNVGAEKSEPSANPFALPIEGRTIPLPENLSSGTWQVVNESGRSIRITIDRTSLKGDLVETDSEVTDEDLEEHFCIRTSPTGERWCFIRSYETASPARHVATEFFSPTQTINERQ